MYTLWVGGFHGTRIAPHTPPTYDLTAEGGCGELTTTFGVDAGFEHQALQPGKHVALTLGGWPLWWGYVLDYNRETGELIAQGEYRRNKLALDGAGNATLDLGVAITAAINRGWNVTNPNNVGGSPTGPGTGVLTIAELAKKVSDETGTFIGINGRGEFYQTAPATAHRWLMASGTVALAPTGEGTADYLAVRFFDGTTYQTTFMGTAGNEDQIDLSDRGTLTDVQAAAIAYGIHGKYLGRLAWAGGVEVPSVHITTRGGTPAALADVRPLSMVRIPGLPVLSAGAMWVDEVIGKTTYTCGADTIMLEPLNIAPRNFTAVTAAA